MSKNRKSCPLCPRLVGFCFWRTVAGKWRLFCDTCGQDVTGRKRATY